MIHPPERTAVRLLNDGPMKWPLWFDNSVADDSNRQPISGALKSALVELTQFYHDHFDNWWDSEENTATYNQKGLALARDVAIELGTGYKVLFLAQQTPTEQQRWIEMPLGEVPPNG